MRHTFNKCSRGPSWTTETIAPANKPLSITLTRAACTTACYYATTDHNSAYPEWNITCATRAHLVHLHRTHWHAVLPLYQHCNVLGLTNCADSVANLACKITWQRSTTARSQYLPFITTTPHGQSCGAACLYSSGAWPDALTSRDSRVSIVRYILRTYYSIHIMYKTTWSYPAQNVPDCANKKCKVEAITSLFALDKHANRPTSPYGNHFQGCTTT
jgi:hypothetical protein